MSQLPTLLSILALVGARLDLSVYRPDDQQEFFYVGEKNGRKLFCELRRQTAAFSYSRCLAMIRTDTSRIPTAFSIDEKLRIVPPENYDSTLAVPSVVQVLFERLELGQTRFLADQSSADEITFEADASGWGEERKRLRHERWRLKNGKFELLEEQRRGK